MNLNHSTLLLLSEVKPNGSTGHVCDLVHLQDTKIFIYRYPTWKELEGGVPPQMKITAFSNLLCT